MFGLGSADLIFKATERHSFGWTSYQSIYAPRNIHTVRSLCRAILQKGYPHPCISIMIRELHRLSKEMAYGTSK